MEARIAANLRKPPESEVIPAAACESERQLHEDILAECRRRGWICFHGSMAHRTHRTVAEPDFLILADEARVFIIEAKSKKRKMSTEQIALQMWANKLGHHIWEVRSFQEFLTLVAPAIATAP